MKCVCFTKVLDMYKNMGNLQNFNVDRSKLCYGHINFRSHWCQRCVIYEQMGAEDQVSQMNLLKVGSMFVSSLHTCYFSKQTE